MDEFVFRMAQSDDERELRKLTALPIPGGWVDLSYRREPDFFSGLCSPDDEVMVGRLKNGPLVAMAVRSSREVYLNGEPTQVGYLSGLRVDPAFQGRHLLWKGYRLLNELQKGHPIDEQMAAIVGGNRLAEILLVQKRRRNWPIFEGYGQLFTLALGVGRRYALSDLETGGPPVDDFLQEYGPQRHYFPVQAREAAWETTRWLAHDEGVLAIRDPARFRQTVVHRYKPPLNWLRPFYNAWSRLRSRPLLPPTGARLRGVYAGFVCARGTRGFRRLLEGALELARRDGHSWLYLGLLKGDPHLEAALQYPHTLYRSSLYRVYWVGQKRLVLDSRPGYVELAGL